MLYSISSSHLKFYGLGVKSWAPNTFNPESRFPVTLKKVPFWKLAKCSCDFTDFIEVVDKLIAIGAWKKRKKINFLEKKW